MRNLSLLPYLQFAKHPLSLKIPLFTEDHSILEQTKFPFSLVADSDPLARLLEAKFVTDADIEVKKLFLLIQKDHYSLPQNTFWAMNNRDIENSWQKAFIFYNAGKQGGSLTFLGDQIDEKGGFRPLQSLFFCKARNLFFHPVCPHCGLPLQQCYEDQILGSVGLQPYSSSLQRYLFCPSCFPKGISNFYSYDLAPFDPSSLKDPSALIREFGKLQENQNPEDPLPCIGCEKHGECYGPRCFALSRITPFSFYPFFMFIFDATCSINAMDFLSLVSGSTFAEVEAQLRNRRELGRVRWLKSIQQNLKQRTPNFFEHGEFGFGEVFYLKLTFLNELIRIISSRGGFAVHPDLRLGIDRLWVRLADFDGIIPFGGTFQVDLIEAGSISHELPLFLNLPRSQCLHLLSCLWFYTLLVNKKQNVTQVWQFLGKLLERLGTSPDFTLTREGNTFPALLPNNIFWDPEGKQVGENWHALWEKALALGSSLIKSSLEPESQWPEEDFLRELNELRREVKEALFMAKPAAKKREAAYDSEEIFKILSNILKKWQTPGAKPEEEMSEPKTLPLERAREHIAPKYEVTETVILSPKDYGKRLPAKDDLARTIDLSREGLKKEPPKSSFQDIKMNGDTTETVVISTRAASTPGSFPRISGKNQMISRGKDSLKGGGRGERLPEDAEEDFLSETIALDAKTIKDKKESKG